MDQADDSATTLANPVAPNYLYWREHGGEWAEEYARRKRCEPLYHIQEVMLVEYFLYHGPARVLEFGCGPGRHLRNISALPGLEVYGFDQSQSMVQGCLTWTDQSWIDAHISVGDPGTRLPFDDDEFDIVYTAEVLVHVRPEDLEGILADLLRVCRGHVLHLETNEHYMLVAGSHDGCWKHDLVAAYARLGRDCEVLPSGYTAHTPYRVFKTKADSRWTWPPYLLTMYRRMEQELKAGFAERQEALEAARGMLRTQQAELDSIPARMRAQADQLKSEMESQADRLRNEIAGLQQANAQLQARCAETECARQADLAAAFGERQELNHHCADLEREYEKARVQLAALERFVHRLSRILPDRRV